VAQFVPMPRPNPANRYETETPRDPHQRPRTIPRATRATPPSGPRPEPACACCQTHAPTREVVRRGIECSHCNYVLWERQA